jgi:hypothetical protein
MLVIIIYENKTIALRTFRKNVTQLRVKDFGQSEREEVSKMAIFVNQGGGDSSQY